MADSTKKSCKSITLDMKAKMIKLYDEGVTQAEIGRRLGYTRTTVNTVIKNREKLLAEIKSATPVNTTTIRKRDSIVADMERLLILWIENQTTRHVPVNQAIIQTKALSLFNDLKAKKGETAKDAEFSASRGWFDRFKKRSNLHNIKIQGEAAAADHKAAESYPRELAKIIQDGGYSMDQIFNVDETGLFWKKMPARTFIAIQERSMPGYKPAKDRITLLLGGNASGTLKLKPLLIYRWENPRALKNYVKTRLPVHWRANKKAWVTAALFEDWFDTCFVPEVKAYCKDNNIPFHILLLVDNAPGHPRTLDELNPNIRVQFLPPNTTSLLQPMDQCVIAAFKLNYLKRTFIKCIAAIDKEEGDGKEVLSKFWKSYNILDCIKTIRDAWNDIKETTMKRAWKKLCPQLVDDSEGCEDHVATVTENIVDMARQLELEVEPEDVAELLASHTESLSNEDLLELEEEREEDVQDGVEIIDHQPEGLTTKILFEAFRHLDSAMALFEKHDRDFERSSKVNANISGAYACYKEIYREKKRATLQTSIETYFSKSPSARGSSSTDSLFPALTSPPCPAPIATCSTPNSPARKRLIFEDLTCETEDTCIPDSPFPALTSPSSPAPTLISSCSTPISPARKRLAFEDLTSETEDTCMPSPFLPQ
ncbi:tigger transposable element-derived protein 1-like [Rana temporaria]|uniref:tigger transposable element-derived protein 1-like n=1 Tax=Rana temporaria TaxID=8407 RepID=UPI001AAD31F1|nr:tigger transposable element-derived protein 1-like [Rana temporaria]XP_040194035.1 tigger transposable element-derived protein 1-like [Rana temporaria]